MGDFKTLRAWQAARDLVVASRKAIRQLPTDERFLLADQWRRAVQSTGGVGLLTRV
ncbi:MAG: hypothetical protein DMD37_12595 [Gemmatimonadetes bacterium]|nr:MAG: hypothetical protein DMD74_07395 [Gemmatimonadota bacterium]PYO70918.1 MAG: hypothetical protein DMD71_00335 [Gemmatimonadota bacterium]PYO83865.1 MAG: hypothetical protein DMD68_08425 [Gemmatimonadota bacterium]PYP61740.1 MAG: hypothetical protein DMD37_12595 [Gemmatimonadota bacterium]